MHHVEPSLIYHVGPSLKRSRLNSRVALVPRCILLNHPRFTTWNPRSILESLSTSSSSCVALAVAALREDGGCRSMADCQNATHPMLRRLHVVPPAELPYEHTPCHAKRTGKHHVQTLCMRSNDSKPHYVSLPEAAYSFYKANPRGKRLHSSAPGFFQSHCDGAVPSGANDRNPGKLSTGWWTRT